MTSLAEAFGLGRGCFGREGVLRCTGTFPETGGCFRAITDFDNDHQPVILRERHDIPTILVKAAGSIQY